jgi:membrane protease YdiL (CAAX protease family)
MSDRTAARRPPRPRSLRPVVARHPVAAFLVLVYGIIAGLAVVSALTGPGLLPGGATLHGLLENILGAAVPAFVVTAIVSGRDGVRDLARRCLRWRVPVRWYAIALLAPPAVLLASVTALYGLAPLRAPVEHWPLLLTSFLPTLVVMVVFNSVAEEAGWTGFLFARLQERHGPLRAAAVTTVFFWLYHVPGFLVDTGSWVLTAALMGFLLLPHLASRLVVGWLYNATGASVLIAGLFHAMHNAMVNPTGLGVAVLGLPQEEVLAVLAGLVVLAGVAVAAATRGRLGLSPAVRAEPVSGAP